MYGPNKRRTGKFIRKDGAISWGEASEEFDGLVVSSIYRDGSPACLWDEGTSSWFIEPSNVANWPNRTDPVAPCILTPGDAERTIAWLSGGGALS